MPTSFTNSGSLNGANPVVLQARPPSGSLLVRELFIYNCDTVNSTVTVYLDSGATIFRGELSPGDMLQLAHHDVVVLNTSSDLLAKADAPAATTEPTWIIGLAYENEV
jgi:hypothetical protein